MSRYTPASYRTIVAVDMADFTNPRRTDAHRKAMRNGLYGILEGAFDEVGIPWGDCEHGDEGDGAYILLPPEIPKELVAERFAHRLRAGLLRHNAIHAAEAAIHLRLALHAGDIRYDEKGKSSSALNFAFRILEMPEAKARIGPAKGILAVIASDVFYQDVIMADPANEPESFQLVPFAVKQTRGAAWLRVYARATGAEAAAAEAVVLDLFLPDELDRLGDLLADVDLPHASRLAVEVAGPGVDPPPAGASAWAAAKHLLDFNAGADSVPPVMAYLELVAAEVGGIAGGGLLAWNEVQAQRMGLGARLQELRADTRRPAPAKPVLHLVILIEYDLHDPDRYLISHWRQESPDEWPPPRGQTRYARLTELEAQVDYLVVAAEQAWSGHQGAVGLEFVLPRALLNLPVDHWCKERESWAPRPLALDYPIVVRPLERMNSPQWHREWRTRWQSLADDVGHARVYYPNPADLGVPYRIDVGLKDPHVVSIVLSEAPSEQPKQVDEFAIAVRSGIPVIVWSREHGVEALRPLMSRLTNGNGLAELPMRSLQARQAALGGYADASLVHSLVVLWDDPRRLVILDPPPLRRPPEEDTRE